MIETILIVGGIAGLYLIMLGIVLRAHYIARRRNRWPGLDD